MKYTSVVFCSG